MSKLEKTNNQSLLSTLTRRTLIATAATVITGASMLSSAANATTLKWAHVYEAGSPYHEAVLWAADEINKQTDGRVSINAYPASSLGKEAELNEALDFGTVDIIFTGEIFAGQAYAPMKISSFPFVIRDYNHWKAYRDSTLFQEISAGYEKATGHDVASFTYYGSRHVTSNKPINTPADMKDLKIRVPNAPLFLMFPKAVGANPTPLAFSEVYLALQQGLVDAQENPLPTIKFKKFYEVQKYINLTGHMSNSLLTIISNYSKNKISASDYDKLVAITKQAANKASDQINDAEQNLSAWFTKQGVTVNKVNKKPFQDAIKPYLNDSDNGFTAEQLARLEAL
ncbi:sialic acid TRAP transporter substrate-binding protein SiaP [Marinomonas transparens]|uniref:Sialic acid TRAP transporter substrate-binding protein SiaP n=1 Tax=Marinomonas transparens TaxID=2795388 RepID=A0A934JP46_9GAMM|nr:sialic acid TRAP transporter substrate-binding protein SiaP [Marinomonas transparens]MBJ7539371.1 sialic acid TRAP transporter substrate-binding protein SiaP [Marinomonas transparens]